MTDNKHNPTTDSSIYTVRAEKRARKFLIAGILTALLSSATFAFLLVFSVNGERPNFVLILLAGVSAFSIYRAVQGYNTLKRLKSTGAV